MHLSPSVIGYMMASRRLVIFVGAPVFTWLCDMTRRHRMLLLIAHMGYYTCTLVLAHVRSLHTVLAVIVLRELFISGCEPTVNNAAIATLEETQKHRTGYGTLRLWGSVGWGLASVVGPYVSRLFFGGDLLVILYTQVLFGVGVLCVLAFALDLSPALFERQTRRKQLRSGGDAHGSTRVMLRLLLSSPRVMYCMLTVLVQGVVLGVFQMTVFIYFSSLGVSTTSLGLSVFFSCGAEALTFFCDTWFWRRFGGAHAGFNYGLLMSSFTMVAYCVVQFMPNRSAAFVLVEVMNGGTYALFLTSALEITNQLAPATLNSTAQGVLCALFYGIGPAAGALLSGVGYERLGAPALYCGLALLQIMIVALPYALRIDLNVAHAAAVTEGEAQAQAQSRGDQEHGKRHRANDAETEPLLRREGLRADGAC
ncbi:unnamed protein product [Agarophyton chilense]